MVKISCIRDPELLERWLRESHQPEAVKDALRNPEIWEGDDVAVAARINEILASYSVENSANAERVFINNEGLFEVEPVLGIHSYFFEIAVERVRDAISEIRETASKSNFYSTIASDIDRLEYYIDKYPETPLRIYEIVARTIRIFELKSSNGEIPDGDVRIEDFKIQLENTELDILQNDTFVRKAVQLRANVRFERMSQNEKTQYLGLMKYLADSSDNNLGREMVEDSELATDHNGIEAQQHEARYRSGSRALRMQQLLKSESNEAIAAKIGGVAGIGGVFALIASWFL